MRHTVAINGPLNFTLRSSCCGYGYDVQPQQNRAAVLAVNYPNEHVGLLFFG